MKSHNKHDLIAVIVLLALFTINWISNNKLQQAPAISFTDIDGQQHTLTQYLGKPVLVVFWATDCPGCIAEMPELIKLHHELSSQGLTIMGVAMPHDSIKHIQAMRQAKLLPYILTWDKHANIGRAFDNVRVTPTHFLINPEGEIVMRKIGTLNTNNLYNALHEMGLKPS